MSDRKSKTGRALVSLALSGGLAITAIGGVAVLSPQSAFAYGPPPAASEQIIDQTSPHLSGYALTASDEFNGTDINRSLFMDRYLPHWSTSPGTKANFEVSNGSLKLYIKKGQTPWDPHHDRETTVSSIQTFNKDYIHRWSNYKDVAQNTEPFRGFIQKYGYFEIRAKAAPGGGVHSAWWMTGVNQDLPEGVNKQARQTGEVDIFEILGRNGGKEARMTVHPWGDKLKLGLLPTTGLFGDGSDYTSAWHTYGYEWTPTQLRLYVDGKHVATRNKKIDYPMMMYLGVYEKTQAVTWTGPYDPTVPYPKTFEVDYMRAYQKVPTLPYSQRINDGFLRGQTVAAGDTTRWLGGSGNDATLTQVWAPKAGNYQVAVDYRSGSDRDLVVQVNSGQSKKFSQLNSGSFDGAFKQLSMVVPLKKGWNRMHFSNPAGPAPDLGNLTVKGLAEKISDTITAQEGHYQNRAVYRNNRGRWIGDGPGNTVTLSNVFVPADGKYRLGITYLSQGARSYDVTVNRQKKIRLDRLDSGSWEKPAVVYFDVDLKSGFNEITLGRDDGPAPDFLSLKVQNQR